MYTFKHGTLAESVVLLALLLPPIAFGQLWIRSLDGGSMGNDGACDLSINSRGGLLVAGSIDRRSHEAACLVHLDSAGSVLWVATHDEYPGFSQKGIALSLTHMGQACFAVASKDSGGAWGYGTAMHDSAGTELWSARYTDTLRLSDYPYDLASSPSGRSVVTGRSTRSPGNSDVLTVSYDSSGEELWVRSYGGPSGGSDRGSAVCTDALGSAYVAGYVSGTQWTCGVVIKYDSVGDIVWQNSYSPPDEHAAYAAIAVGVGEGVFVTGYQGPVYTKILTAKCNPSGDTAWTRLYYRGLGVAIRADDAGSAYVVGTDAQTGSSSDIITLKYDSSGTLRWAARYDGPDQMDDVGNDIALGPDGSVYVCGNSESTQYGRECILIRYDVAGDTVWTARICGDGRYGTSGNAVAVDAQGNIIVAGSINKSSTGNDYLVAKYPPTGPGIAESQTEVVRRGGVSAAPSVARSACLLTGNACSDGHRFLTSDMSGQIVKRLSACRSSRRTTRVVWNLDDDSGHLVPDGVYFVTLDAPGQSACAKIIVQR